MFQHADLFAEELGELFIMEGAGDEQAGRQVLSLAIYAAAAAGQAARGWVVGWSVGRRPAAFWWWWKNRAPFVGLGGPGGPFLPDSDSYRLFVLRHENCIRRIAYASAYFRERSTEMETGFSFLQMLGLISRESRCNAWPSPLAAIGFACFLR